MILPLKNAFEEFQTRQSRLLGIEPFELSVEVFLFRFPFKFPFKLLVFERRPENI